MEGYIKLHRKMMQWEWYTDVPTKCVFLHLLFLAQYEPGCYRGVQLEAGQAVASIRSLAAETGLSVQSVRTAILHLVATQELTQHPHGKFSVFTLKNYLEYQGCNTEINKQITQHQHSTNTDPYIKKERNKENKKKDISIEISKKPYGEFANVLLTGQEHEKLVDSLGQTSALEYIERLSAYLAQTGKRYKSHYATLLNWWRRDGKQANAVRQPVVQGGSTSSRPATTNPFLLLEVQDD